MADLHLRSYGAYRGSFIKSAHHDCVFLVVRITLHSEGASAIRVTEMGDKIEFQEIITSSINCSLYQRTREQQNQTGFVTRHASNVGQAIKHQSVLSIDVWSHPNRALSHLRRE